LAVSPTAAPPASAPAGKTSGPAPCRLPCTSLYNRSPIPPTWNSV